MKRHLAGLLLILVFAGFVAAQDSRTVAPPEPIVTEGVPPVPATLAEAAGRYSETRSAFPTDWHPQRRELLIGTRFGNTYQAHLVKMPGGARQQLTFSTDPVYGGRFQPTTGEYMVFQRDIGGGEWYQLYRYDLATGDITLLTDGKSRNIAGPWSMKGDRMAYTSTRRTGQDTDLWVINPTDPKSDRLVAQLKGGGWEPQDWSPDDSKVLVLEGISVNETYLWLFDAASGDKTELTPRKADEKIAYSNPRFSKDGKGIYYTADAGSEFQGLMYLDLATKQSKVLTAGLSWDVDEFALSWDGKRIAFLTNEDGLSTLHLMDTATGKELPVPKLPVGVVGGLIWHRNNHDLAFGVTSASLPGDCFSLDINSGKLDRWTMSESAVKTDAFREPELIRWKSFDGKMISGFLYAPPAKFTGKRPVLIEIHGGPEGQSRPDFLGRANYYLNVLGIAMVVPNVRGSTGYGKTFTKLDNGFSREDSYKDINALLRLDRHPAGLGCFAHRRHRRQLWGPHDAGDLHVLQRSHSLLCRHCGHVQPCHLFGTHRGLPARFTPRRIWRRARPYDARISGTHRAHEQHRQNQKTDDGRGRKERPTRPSERKRSDCRRTEETGHSGVVHHGPR